MVPTWSSPALKTTSPLWRPGIAHQLVEGLRGPRKGFLKHFCKLFLQNGKIMMKNNKIILFSMIFSLFTSIFLFFDAFLNIHFFAENQRLIFDEKMDNQKSVKNKNMIKKIGNHTKKQQI